MRVSIDYRAGLAQFLRQLARMDLHGEPASSGKTPMVTVRRGPGGAAVGLIKAGEFVHIDGDEIWITPDMKGEQRGEA